MGGITANPTYEEVCAHTTGHVEAVEIVFDPAMVSYAQLLDRWARRSFRAYARYWVEGARLPGTSSDEVVQRTFVDGLHHLHEGAPPDGGRSWPCRTSAVGSTVAPSWRRRTCP